VPSSTATRTAVALGTAGLAVGVGALSSDAAPKHPAVAVVDPVVQRPSAEVSQQAGSLLAAHADTSRRRASVDSRVSRSQIRPVLLKDQRATKAASLPPSRQSLGGAITRSVAPPTPREIAMSLLSSQGWDSGQFSCLDALWTKESGWNPYAENSTSGAYGIPQALPGSKMATSGGDWATNPTTQIEWGLNYIRLSYGSPCGAWYHSESYGWY